MPASDSDENNHLLGRLFNAITAQSEKLWKEIETLEKNTQGT